MNILTIVGYLAVLFCTVLSLKGIGYQYMNAPSLILMLAFFLLTLLGTGNMKNFWNGLMIGFRRKRSYSMMELKKADGILLCANRNVLLSGCILFLMSMISMLYRLADPSGIGPSIAFGLLSVLYALIFALILTPVRIRLHMLIITYAEEDATGKNQPDAEAMEQKIYFLLRSMGLTDREAEVARLISQDLSNREISERLYISQSTVKKHVTHILEKMQLDKREALAEFIHSNRTC